MTVVKHSVPLDIVLTAKERDLVCQGKICPECKGGNVEHVGSNPDGRSMNHAYDCSDCGAQWEGY
jgi:predicted RNA-binding Zn-ribbon protein involved in translation (DUF1610 family)